MHDVFRSGCWHSNIASAPPTIDYLSSCLAHPTTYSPLGMALGCGRILTWSSSICQPSQSRRFSFLGYTKQLSLRLIPGTNTTASATATRLCQEKVSLSFSFLVLFCLIYLGEGETQQIITIITVFGPCDYKKRRKLKWSTENKEMFDFELLQADNLLVWVRKPTRL